MKSFTKGLAEAGELVSAEGLAAPHEAKIVRAGEDSAPITDGVFPEAKEFLAGYWIMAVESPERAYAIAAAASAAPGPGGVPMAGLPTPHTGLISAAMIRIIASRTSHPRFRHRLSSDPPRDAPLA
jgi:hypothetical protein